MPRASLPRVDRWFRLRIPRVRNTSGGGERPAGASGRRPAVAPNRNCAPCAPSPADLFPLGFPRRSCPSCVSGRPSVLHIAEWCRHGRQLLPLQPAPRQTRPSTNAEKIVEPNALFWLRDSVVGSQLERKNEPPAYLPVRANLRHGEGTVSDFVTSEMLMRFFDLEASPAERRAVARKVSTSKRLQYELRFLEFTRSCLRNAPPQPGVSGANSDPNPEGTGTPESTGRGT
jgi:hypothetical protein